MFRVLHFYLGSISESNKLWKVSSVRSSALRSIPHKQIKAVKAPQAICFYLKLQEKQNNVLIFCEKWTESVYKNWILFMYNRIAQESVCPQCHLEIGVPVPKALLACGKKEKNKG